MSSPAEEYSVDQLTLCAVRAELHRLVSLADSAERPKPTRIRQADQSWPGFEWELVEQVRRSGERNYTWLIRTADEDAETSDGLVYLSSPQSSDLPGDEFTPLRTVDARRLALALLAAADRADHVAHGVTRLEDRRRTEAQR